jgi:hypothetical protein
MNLLERVDFNLRWEARHGPPKARTDETIERVINAMTPLELLTRISEALEELKEMSND